MLTACPVPQFAPADLIIYQGSGEYVVLSVNNILGLNKYNLLNIKNGHQIQASTHELQKIYGTTLMGEENYDEMQLNEEMDKKSRFNILEPL